MSVLNFVTWAVLIVGIICVIVSFTMFRRKNGEAEVSQSLTTIPAFIAGVVLTAVGVLGKIILQFI